MRELALHLLKSLADRPESVTVTEEVDGDVLVLVARVADDDKGKVIGKGGKVIKAVRAVVALAAAKAGKKVELDLDS